MKYDKIAPATKLLKFVFKMEMDTVQMQYSDSRDGWEGGRVGGVARNRSMKQNKKTHSYKHSVSLSPLTHRGHSCTEPAVIHHMDGRGKYACSTVFI